MLYASLTGPLFGIYFPVPTDDENTAREMLNSSKLRDLWCSIYTKDRILDLNHYSLILNDKFAKHLDYQTHKLTNVSLVLAEFR